MTAAERQGAWGPRNVLKRLNPSKPSPPYDLCGFFVLDEIEFFKSKSRALSSLVNADLLIINGPVNHTFPGDQG
jgi:hypothetical protein